MLKQIGSGMSCVVFLAEHKKLHHICAIKCISKTTGDSSIFLREAEFLRNLNNLYAPILYDFEEDDSYWYLIEEYIEGQSLLNLGKCHTIISQDRLLEIAIKICEAIKWLHERKPYPVLYLDLKPEHVRITGQGIKLLDFGSAVYLKGESISGSVMGTAGFASPEQLRGENIDQRSDIYSIGAVFFWLMTGRVMEAQEEFQAVHSYSGEWNAIVEKCLEQEAGKRYASVLQLMQEIQSLKQAKQQRQLNKSLKIAVTGCQNRIGATHFAMGLSISCKKLGMDCLYEEKNDSGAIQEIFNHSPKARESKGIYYLPGFEAIPYYGQAVGEEQNNCRMLICDYGKFDERRIHEYEEADCMIVVAGSKEWEIQKTKDLIERYKQRKNMYYVLRAANTAQFYHVKKEFMIQNLFLMPEYSQPFSIGKRQLRFYKALLSHIVNGLTRRMKKIEKMQKKKLHNYSWPSGSR